MARRPKHRKGDEQVATTAKDGRALVDDEGMMAKNTLFVTGIYRLPWDPHPNNSRKFIAYQGNPTKNIMNPRSDCLLGGVVSHFVG